MNNVIYERNNALLVLVDSVDGASEMTVTNFYPEIAKQITKIRNGKEGEVQYVIRSTSKNGDVLPEVILPAEQLYNKNWPAQHYGVDGRITPPISKNLVNVAEYMHDNSTPQKINHYLNSGFQSLGEELFFIHGRGLVGSPKVKGVAELGAEGKLAEVKLHSSIPTKEESRSVAAKPLIFSNLYKGEPFKGSVLLATIVRSAMCFFDELATPPLFIVAPSGSQKTEVALLLQKFYMPELKESFSNWSSTSASIQDAIVGLDGCIMLIDDFVSKDGPKSDRELDEKIEEVVRNVANRTIKETTKRSNSKYHPTVVITGEHTPIKAHDSLHKRIIYLEGSGIDLKVLTHLQELQKDGCFSIFITDFISFALANRRRFESLIKIKKPRYENRFRKQAPHLHSRQPEQFATLLLCIEVYARYLNARRVLPTKGIRRFVEHNFELLLHSAKSQSAIVEERNPRELIWSAIRKRIDERVIYFEEHGKDVRSKLKESEAIFVGWRSEQGDFDCVATVSPEELVGESLLIHLNLPASKTAFFKYLARLGMLHLPTGDGKRLTKRTSIKGVTKRVYRLK